nr:ARM REPEAT PROTEIN INTERACTING WITH ABF2-like [Ipomoea batatas]
MENRNQKSSERLSSSGSRRSLKRKVEEVLEHDRSRNVSLFVEEAHRDLVVKVCTQVEILEASFSSMDF